MCPNVMCWDELLGAHRHTSCGPEFPERSASSLCYTSGTTGNPKRVLYQHRFTVLHALMELSATPSTSTAELPCSWSCRCSTRTPGLALRRGQDRRRAGPARRCHRPRAAVLYRLRAVDGLRGLPDGAHPGILAGPGVMSRPGPGRPTTRRSPSGWRTPAGSSPRRR